MSSSLVFSFMILMISFAHGETGRVCWFSSSLPSSDLAQLRIIPNIGRRIHPIISITVKPVLSGHSKRTPKLVLNTDYRLMQVKSIAECSKGSILQYFRPSLSYHLSLRPFI